MATVKLSKGIVSEAKIMSKALNRSLAGQIEHWAKIGRFLLLIFFLHWFLRTPQIFVEKI